MAQRRIFVGLNRYHPFPAILELLSRHVCQHCTGCPAVGIGRICFYLVTKVFSSTVAIVFNVESESYYSDEGADLLAEGTDYLKKELMPWE